MQEPEILCGDRSWKNIHVWIRHFVVKHNDSVRVKSIAFFRFNSNNKCTIMNKILNGYTSLTYLQMT